MDEQAMIFYTYLWLRDDGSPYYVGKGKGDRAFVRQGHCVNPPLDEESVLLQEFPDEAAAFAAEQFFISFYGRKDLGTGCLRNRTDGGIGGIANRGKPHSLQHRQNISKALTGKKPSEETLRKLRASHLGHRRSLETTEKIRSSLFGNKHALGYKHTAETKQRMSIGQQRRRNAERS